LSVDFDPRQLFEEMGQESWAQWMHSPITKAFFDFLSHQHENWREIAADLVEYGHLKPGAEHEDQNIDVVRGKLATLRLLRGISLSDIQRFYGVLHEEPAVEENEEPGT
jgi:hypothetical protein